MLVADFLEMRDLFETKLRVECDAGHLFGIDAAENGVMAELLSEFDESSQ